MLSALWAGTPGSGEGLHIAVIGWNTGVLGKLVFFVGFALIVLVARRARPGIELPPTVPESLVVVALGALATIFVIVRLITIPEDLLPAHGRGIGLCVSLVAGAARDRGRDRASLRRDVSAAQPSAVPSAAPASTSTG